MDAPFYPEVCARHGISVLVPAAAERAWIHERYVGELLNGEFRDETRQRITSIVGALREAHGIDGVILAGPSCRCCCPEPPSPVCLRSTPRRYT